MSTAQDPRPNDELNRIIAAWMGYTNFRQARHGWVCVKPENLRTGIRKNTILVTVPQYSSHRDTIAQAEAKLEKGESIFLSAYCEILLGGRHHTSWLDNWPAINAGARQRAEALVKVIEGGLT